MRDGCLVHSAGLVIPYVDDRFALRAAAVLGEGLAAGRVAGTALADGAAFQVGGDEPGPLVADAAPGRSAAVAFGGVGVFGAVFFEVPVLLASEAFDVFESHFNFRLSRFARYYGYC